MKETNDNALCKEAEVYYFDMISASAEGQIPEGIQAHVSSCPNCQEHLRELGSCLSELYTSADVEKKQAESARINMLTVHLNYIGHAVTCDIVRPLLPSQVEPLLQVKVPTPITVHLDHCQECRMDLEAIRDLNLNAKQLKRLNLLLAAQLSAGAGGCPPVRSAHLPFIAFEWDKISDQTLRHLCLCPTCQVLVYNFRQDMINKLPESEQGAFPCDEVSYSDVFDYCYPYEIEPAEDQYAKFRPSFVSHLRNCSKCLYKMQTVQKTVFAVAQRPPSQVVTTYTLDVSGKTDDRPENPYVGFPVKVEVRTGGEEAVADREAHAPFRPLVAKKPKVASIGPLAKAAIAAAIILAAAVLFVSIMPRAQATTIKQIYEAIAKARNIYMAKFAEDQTQPIQEKWVSRSLNIYMTKTRDEIVFWNISKAEKTIKLVGGLGPETLRVPEVELANVRQKLAGSLGIMPFENLSHIPLSAGWKEISHSNVEGSSGSAALYELTWTSRTHGDQRLRYKWRAFVDEATHVPQRVELYWSSGGEAKFVLQAAANVEYLSDNDMRDAITRFGFEVGSLGTP